MKKTILLVNLIIGLIFTSCQSPQSKWQIAKNPLLTQWASDVDPENPWPEYPRPQMVRENWLNLNGLWDYAILPKENSEPETPEPEEDRAIVLGEFGGLGLPVEKHTWEEKAWGYRNMKDFNELLEKYEEFYSIVWQFKDNPGLSAAVYTQTTDVETETNGLMTYDRKIIKLNPGDAYKINTNK